MGISLPGAAILSAALAIMVAIVAFCLQAWIRWVNKALDAHADAIIWSVRKIEQVEGSVPVGVEVVPNGSVRLTYKENSEEPDQ